MVGTRSEEWEEYESSMQREQQREKRNLVVVSRKAGCGFTTPNSRQQGRYELADVRS